MNRRSILAAYKKKNSHLQTGVTGFKSGNLFKTDSDSQLSNKCAALVSLRNMNTSITGFLPVKSPTNPYISFILQQEVVHKHYSAAFPHTAPVAARNAPVLAHLHRHQRGALPAKYCPKFPAFRGFFILPQRHLPERDFPVQVNPAQINN